MYLEAVMKCDKDNTPYRVYLNNELVTERYFALDEKTLSNNLQLNVTPSDKYDVRIESLTDVSVKLIDYFVSEKKSSEQIAMGR